ncbi:MAG: Asp/Glu racemase [Pseudomonadota bacterium]
MDLPYTLSADRPPQIGMVVLQADETIERDMRRLLPAEAELLVSRVPSGRDVNAASLAAMEDVLTEAARLFPSGARFSAIGYGCTSGTAQIGAGRIRALIQAGAETPCVTEPVSALIAACRALGVRRIGLVSPYVAEVSDRLRQVLAEAGIDVSGFASFNQSREETVARISAQSIRDAAQNVADHAECEAVFLSCTNLRTLDVIDAVERATGTPVLTSNQVLGWHLTALAGLPRPKHAPGRLWAREAVTAST